MLLSICIPSYNRGHRAAGLVKRCLNMAYGKEEIEVICSNNGSVKNVEGYQELKKIEDERFHYHEFAENQGFSANLNQVIKMSQGEFCLLLSDEDTIVEENLEYYLLLLKKYPQLGIVKGRTTRMYAHLKTRYEKAGKGAIDAFYMNGNYVSGVIYNRKIITDETIDTYSKKYNSNVAYQYYPHMFYDAFVLIQGEFLSSDELLVDEGLAENDLTIAENGPDNLVAEYGTYESRLKQMHGFVEQICDLQISFDLKFEMLLMLYEKTCFLINLHRDKYIANGYEWNMIMGLISKEMKRELRAVNLPLSAEEMEAVYEYIEILTEEREENVI